MRDSRDNPVDTGRRFNVDTTSYDVEQGRIDIETTSCVYWEDERFLSLMELMLITQSSMAVQPSFGWNFQQDLVYLTKCFIMIMLPVTPMRTYRFTLFLL